MANTRRLGAGGLGAREGAPDLGRRVRAHVALDGMEAAAKQINVRLDDEHARKLAELAAERHVEEVELAGEVLD